MNFGALIGFPVFSLILSVLEFGLVGLIDLPANHEVDKIKFCKFMFRNNKYSSHYSVVSFVLKLITVIFGITSIVTFVMFGVFINETAMYICMGIMFGVHLLYSVLLTVLRFKHNDEEGKYQ